MTIDLKKMTSKMKRKAIIIFLLLSYFTVSSFAQQKKIDVTYVGNAGFLIEIGNKKILIDALFKGFEGDYNLPQDIQDKLTSAKAPFNDVDLILVTHAHGDHINPDMVRQHMQNNPKAIFVSTKQLVDHMKDSSNRSIGFNPTKEKSENKVIQGINIEAFYLPHGPDSRIINIGFLISVDGANIFQTGDADFDQFSFEEFRSFNLLEKKIDLLFIQHYYLRGDSLSDKFIKEAIGAKYILPIHYHFTSPVFDSILVKQNYPDAILFNEELQTWHMPTKNSEMSTIGELYFNQPLPGDSAVIFAPGIVSVNGRYEFAVSFSPDLDEIYFTGKRKGERSSIYFSKLIDKEWTNPQKANLTKGKKGEMEAFVNHSGSKIYFTASDSKGVEIWYANRFENWWTNAEKLNSPINDDMVFYSNEAKNGDLFYKNVSKGKMYYAPNKEGKYPEIFEAGIEYGSHGFISPSQDFMLIDALKDNDKTKDKDIHICFKKKDGTWTKPINLGTKVNSKFNETCPSISPDGKYLFFSRYNEEGGIPNIYWMSTNIINKLKEKVVLETSQKELTDLEGDYLGQTPPEEIPLVFAPGIVSTNKTIEHGSPTFSPDGNEVFWQANSLDHKVIQCLTMKRINNVWTKPQLSPYDSGPVFSPDGNRLYYLPFGEEKGEKNGPYFVEKENNEWGDPTCMDLIKRFPDIKFIYNHSFTNNGTIYFLGHAEGYWNNFGIYRSELIDGEYKQPELLPENINIPGNTRNWTPFIAPDETYLLFSSSRSKEKKDSGDIYISFRNTDGSWTKPIYLDENINSPRPERFPTITPDGKYLFFSRFVYRGNEDVMWVSAKCIDEIKRNRSK